MELEGGCLCGAIRYGISGRVSGVGECHCSICRKATGSAYTAVAFTSTKSFRWVQGEETATHFARPRGWSVTFCPTCGAPVTRVHENGKVVVVPAGGIDGDPEIEVMQHIFVGSKAAWDVIGDEAPRHDEWAPEG